MPAARVAPLIAAWQRDHRGLPAPSRPSTAVPLSVTFPATRLVSRVLIALGADLSASPATWQWLDITRFLRQDLGISQTVGRPDESAVVQYGRAALKLDNRDGRFTRRNPTSPYFGLLSMNTPIWVTVDDAGSGEHTRIEMFVNEWPNRWANKAGTDTTVTIQCSGILRRLGQGPPVNGSLRRAIAATSPTSYWSLELGTPTSNVAGGATMTQSGQVQYQTHDGQAGSGKLPDFTGGGKLTAPLAAGSSTSSWRFEFVARFGTGSDTISDVQFTVPVQMVSPSGTVNVWEVLISTGTPIFEWSNTAQDYTGSIVTTIPVDDGQWHHFRLSATQTGADIAVTCHVDGVSGGTATITSRTLDSTGSTIAINPNSDVAAYVGAVGHLAYWAPWSGVADTANAAAGFVGEMAHARIARLCAEEGVQYQSVAARSARMGPQRVDTLLALLREAELSGGGVLYEKHWGLEYKSLAEYCNQPVGLALDFAQGHVSGIPEPADDDQRVRNRWTVSRPGGSEYTAERTSGPMGTGTQGPGTYPDSVTLNVEADIQLPSQAGWRRHLGTVDEDRWPSIDLNFARAPGLIDSWGALPNGARITLSNPPPQMPPGTVDAIIEGYSEQWSPYLWMATLNTSPNSPYRVYTVESASGNLGRVDAAASTLAADATDVATTISVASPNALWRTGAVNLDINVGGEQMTVTNISGGSSPQTFTVTRSVNGVVKAQPATVGAIATKVGLWKPAAYEL